jgi:nucleotidyltransferase/DNA polymerase involved in DNA repair
VGEQRLSEAISICPGLEVVEGSPAQYRAVTEGLLLALDCVVPAVEVAAEGSMLLDLAGMERLHPDPEVLGRAILDVVPSWLGARVAVSDGAFLAGVVARLPGRERVRVALGAQARTLLVRAPISALPLSLETHRRLRLLGVRTIGDVAALPRGSVLAGLGSEGERLWRLAHGEDVDVTQMQTLPERVGVERDLDDPVVNVETLLAHAQEMLTQLCGQALGGRATRQITVRCVTERSDDITRTLTFKVAASRSGPMWDVLRPALQRLDVMSPIVKIALYANDLTAARGWQSDLDLDRRGREDQLEESMRKLRAQFGGRCPVAKFVEVEPWSRVPERRTALVDFIS